MQKGIIGKKIGMTQIFDENGKVVPVTVIEAGPCVVSQKKTVENDGYAAVQMGYRRHEGAQGQQAHAGSFRKGRCRSEEDPARVPPGKHGCLQCGRPRSRPTSSQPATRWTCTGTSKGKGYAGVIKRWNLHRLKETHGSGPVARHAGSNGACSDPSRVFKGKKLRRPPGCGDRSPFRT